MTLPFHAAGFLRASAASSFSALRDLIMIGHCSSASDMSFLALEDAASLALASSASQRLTSFSIRSSVSSPAGNGRGGLLVGSLSPSLSSPPLEGRLFLGFSGWGRFSSCARRASDSRPYFER